MYRRRASPLHAARAGVTSAYGLALVTLALVSTHPLLLGAVASAVVLAAVLAGVGRDLARAALLAVPLALLLALVNALVVREGLTVILQLGEIPPFGLVDVTLEALVTGLLIGARVVVIVLAFALLAACVDPDAALRGLGRLSFRSALTAVLATRMVPVLARDARRMDLALRSRPDSDPGRRAMRLAVVRALATGSLERAVDVAATLELRGYAGRGRRARGLPVPWSRHDWAVLASALALAALVIWAVIGDVAAVESYPRLSIATSAAGPALAGAVVVVALLPFLARRGIAAP
jgi:energy-coupling factor transport system permease protein